MVGGDPCSIESSPKMNHDPIAPLDAVLTKKSSIDSEKLPAGIVDLTMIWPVMVLAGRLV
jgi:hypothetical protein